MFPIRDENPAVLTPYVTIGIVILTTLAWFLVQGAGTSPSLPESVCRFGAIPGDLLDRLPPGAQIPLSEALVCAITPGPSWHTLITSMFMHGGWFHLIGNMWFLWVFGNNIEDSMGHVRFVFFYLICGVIAALAQVFIEPRSPVPMVGASGAISGVMGAYLVLYPRVRVHLLVFLGFFVTTIVVPAYLMLLYWAFLQLLGSVPSLAGMGGEGGVAFMAHLGGFVGGVALIKLFSKPALVAAHRASTIRRPIQERW